MTRPVPVWRARLSEGWCPREGHPALQVPDDPGWHGHGYCTECGVGWLLTADGFAPGVGYLSVRCWNRHTRWVAQRLVDPFVLDGAHPMAASMVLEGESREVLVSAGRLFGSARAD